MRDGLRHLRDHRDWTDCGLAADCVEVAVMSGLPAASALTGSPRPDDIVGYAG